MKTTVSGFEDETKIALRVDSALWSSQFYGGLCMDLLLRHVLRSRLKPRRLWKSGVRKVGAPVLVTRGEMETSVTIGVSFVTRQVVDHGNINRSCGVQQKKLVSLTKKIVRFPRSTEVTRKTKLSSKAQ